MNDPTDRYLGRWQLLPELCLYQHGDPPASGTYEIADRGNEVAIRIEWRDAAGADHAIEFGGIPDGERRVSEAPGVSHVSFTRIDDRILDSAAFANGERVAYARRSASSDGELLATVQAGSTPDGTAFANFQVYRRIS